MSGTQVSSEAHTALSGVSLCQPSGSSKGSVLSFSILVLGILGIFLHVGYTSQLEEFTYGRKHGVP